MSFDDDPIMITDNTAVTISIIINGAKQPQL